MNIILGIVLKLLPRASFSSYTKFNSWKELYHQILLDKLWLLVEE